ncbi:hypothetical protein GCM10009555_018330 [Acrocarpospora macrocephala]|uniref:Uncharacterized protein n=1 Tax=Acrocarpospora macrocephala TaxID=150177 RepID=A0A5M3WKB1_9ACTN|nr:hypothetical protein [Acrocarpospora macrocephala]GES07493.1 hypothetical protein Amac_010880 [Acrocarpospora macrocephala]
MSTSPTVRRVLLIACHVLPIVAPGVPLSEVITRVVGAIKAPGLACEVAVADSLAAVVAHLRIGIKRDPAKIVDDWAANRSLREVRRLLAEIAGDHAVVQQLCDEHDAETRRLERGGLDG